jgi:hypothetical protein
VSGDLGIGLHEGIPHRQYHEDNLNERPTLSSSIASILVDEFSCPADAKARHPRLSRVVGEEDEGEEDEDRSGVKARGNLVHSLLLGGGQDMEVVMRDYPAVKKTGAEAYTGPAENFQSDSAKAYRDRILAEGKMPVLQRKLDDAREAVMAIESRLSLPPMREVSFIWESDGVLCRGRADALWLDEHKGEAIIYDIKTCSNFRSATGGHVMKFHLHIQHAAYIEAIETLFPALAGRVTFKHIFCRVSGRFDVIHRRLSAELAELGRRDWDRAKKAWQECLTSGKWPGMSDVEQFIEAPGYALAQDLEREIRSMPEGGSAEPGF